MVHNNNTMPNFSPDLNALYKGVQMMYHLFLNSSVKGIEISKASLLFAFFKISITHRCIKYQFELTKKHPEEYGYLTKFIKLIKPGCTSQYANQYRIILFKRPTQHITLQT